MRVCILLAAHLLAVSARLLHSLPEDTYAFPKYRVSFLNGLPVLNETAERWLREGLRGGELEFLDQPWKHDDWTPSAHLKEIGSGDPIEQEEAVRILRLPGRTVLKRRILDPCSSVFLFKLYPGAYEDGTSGLVHLSDTETLG